MSAHDFRSHLKDAVEKVLEDHVPLRAKRRGGQDFIVVSAADWEREQETLYVLQNRSLMEQIERSLKTHREGTGYRLDDGKLKLRVLLRDFDTPRLAERAELLRGVAAGIVAEYPQAGTDVRVTPQYRNMAEGLREEPRALAFAEEAMRRAGL